MLDAAVQYDAAVYLYFFFFSSRRRHTSWPCDWSSDVCSSDLEEGRDRLGGDALTGRCHRFDAVDGGHPRTQIGRASCRERVGIAEIAVPLRKNERNMVGEVTRYSS